MIGIRQLFGDLYSNNGFKQASSINLNICGYSQMIFPKDMR